MAVKQTAGRDALGEFAPKFAELNDDVLFGQVWSREDRLSLRDRSLVTVVALMAQGLTDAPAVCEGDVVARNVVFAGSSLGSSLFGANAASSAKRSAPTPALKRP